MRNSPAGPALRALRVPDLRSWRRKGRHLLLLCALRRTIWCSPTSRQGIAMRSFDRREVSYAQARAELTRTMAEVSELPDQDRGEHLERLVRGLQDKYPDLDDQMT